MTEHLDAIERALDGIVRRVPLMGPYYEMLREAQVSLEALRREIEQQAGEIERLRAVIVDLEEKESEGRERFKAAEAAHKELAAKALHENSALLTAQGELAGLREAISPHRVNVGPEYYITVAQKMREREARIKPKRAALDAAREGKV